MGSFQPLRTDEPALFRGESVGRFCPLSGGTTGGAGGQACDRMFQVSLKNCPSLQGNLRETPLPTQLQGEVVTGCCPLAGVISATGAGAASQGPSCTWALRPNPHAAPRRELPTCLSSAHAGAQDHGEARFHLERGHVCPRHPGFLLLLRLTKLVPFWGHKVLFWVWGRPAAQPHMAVPHAACHPGTGCAHRTVRVCSWPHSGYFCSQDPDAAGPVSPPIILWGLAWDLRRPRGLAGLPSKMETSGRLGGSVG